MARISTEEMSSDAPIMSRNTMNYVKWKHKARNSRQLLVIAIIFFVATVIGIIVFVLLISGLILTGNVESQISIEEEQFGSTKDGENIKRYTLQNKHGLTVKVMTLGCTVTSLAVPDRHGRIEDILVGYDNLKDYEEATGPRVGGVIGRLVNTDNSAWDKILWNATRGIDDVTFSHVSSDGDQGLAGTVHVNVKYSLTGDNEVIVSYTAEVYGAASPIDISSYFFFNLAGKDTSNIAEHEITVFADRYLPVGSNGDITGDIDTVAGTYYDLRSPTLLSTKLSDSSGDGFHHNYCVRGPPGKRQAARVSHSPSGRWLEVHTNQPSLQLCAGDHVNTSQSNSMRSCSGLSLTSMNYPEAISHDNFPDNMLHPGSVYMHTTWYKFGIIR